MDNIQKLQELARQIRRDIVRMVHDVNSGHPGGSLGCVEYFVALYFEVMKRKENFHIDGKGEDIFFLSNGHISPVFYATLARAGYFNISELSTFRRINSRLQGHPTTHEGLPGIRVSSGSLGQGISVSIGAALAKKYNNDPHTVFVLCGDGELQEGQNWEAIMSAPNLRVDNLILAVDWNGQQIDGPTEKVMDEGNLAMKFEAFKWQTLVLENGNDLQSVIEKLYEAKALLGNGKPVVILMKTVMGEGVDYMEGNYKWHGVAPNDEQLASALQQLPETSYKDY